MDYTVLVTRFLGIVFTAYGLGMLFNKSTAEDCNKSSLMSGCSLLFWGSFIVVVQQVWTNWSVMTTLAGWLVFLKGLSSVLMPCSSKCDGAKGMCKFLGFIIFVWGVLMMFYGFFGTLHAFEQAVHHI